MMPQLEKVHWRMRWTRGDEIQRVGLVPEGDLQDDRRNKKCVTFNLNVGVFYDIRG